MPRSGKVKVATSLLTLVAVALGAILAVTITFSGGSGEKDRAYSPGITLGLTAEAREALQQSGNAFPASDAGFSAYYRTPDGAGGFALDKIAVDQALLNGSNPTSLRAGVGTLIDMGNNYTVVSVPILNIDGLTTTVHLYYDDQGWIIAYFPRGSESSRAWQAVDLDPENPVLTNVSRTVLMDAINDVLVEGLNTPPVTHDQLGYYHWAYPAATNFLMIATARGLQGSDKVSFAVPASFTMHEVSASMWISQMNMSCAHIILDGIDLMGNQCNRSFHYVFVNLSDFNSLTAHRLQLDHFSQDAGASGALVMLVYSVP